jgi:hypothetical protein
LPSLTLIDTLISALIGKRGSAFAFGVSYALAGTITWIIIRELNKRWPRLTFDRFALTLEEKIQKE